MGLLDDAIREHLELKRRHGADPEEVSRQEREALGAPQRNAEFAQPDAPEDAPVSEADEAPVDAPEAEAAPSEVEQELEPPPELDREPEPPAGTEEDPWLPDEDDEPRPPAAGGAEEPPADDVLEETPEFLQETPEHDRLWFEQKPPRDFDWDK
jgi:hypothetical protein